MTHASTLTVQPLSAQAFQPYGWMLGKPYPGEAPDVAFSNPATDFWREHLFDSGTGGQPEILWVHYRNDGPVTHLEVHHLTQQAIVPLTGPLIHVVAASGPDGQPDLRSLAAFRVPPGQGLCMRPGCWHASRVPAGEVACLMLTRRSTTEDLVPHMRDGAPARESAIVPVTPLAWR